eukprot:TRINITY_DN20982_c0_g1_i2.p1 TRINITY_DN20982_c0_g1~~TRINITY_DN20982_c0_g1_i2.p1  ORF type:complete len:207 (+),score=47.49 TRINITY_DN20982_c0_g1_i2:58-678(+)
MSEASAIFQRFSTLEESWWATQSTDWLEEKGLMPDDMRFAGEILFLLLDLKPAVIFSNLEHITDSFLDQVVRSSGLLDLAHLQLSRLPAGVHTPLCDFSDQYLVWNTRHTHADVVQTLLSSNEEVDEHLIQRVLDYPVCIEDVGQQEGEMLVEIGYVDRTNERLLTSYGAGHKDISVVMQHYQRYRQAAKDVVELQLKMVEVPPEM